MHFPRGAGRSCQEPDPRVPPATSTLREASKRMEATTAFTVKLLINTRARRVVFAETTREVVFFLYSLLASPDSPIPFDEEEETLDGCTSNLAESVQELVDLEDDPPPQQQDPRRFFVCRDKGGAACDGYVAERSGAPCPSCGGLMDAEAPRGAPGASCSRRSEQAPVVQTFTLMDDLTIGPSPVNARAVVTDRTVRAGALQEVTVRLGHEEGLAILEASVESSQVLTDVFLRDKAPVFGGWS